VNPDRYVPKHFNMSRKQLERAIASEGEAVRVAKLQAKYFADWLLDRMCSPAPLVSDEYEWYRKEAREYAMPRSQWTAALTTLFGGSVPKRGRDGRVRRVRLLPVRVSQDTEEESE
jgi:hypothetical protein